MITAYEMTTKELTARLEALADHQHTELLGREVNNIWRQVCREAASRLRSTEAVDEGCICKGNWRAIVKEYGPKIGQTFKRGDKTYRFFGIVHGDDDYYYGLVELGGKVVLSSCVGSLETMGFDDESSPTAGEGKEHG